MRFPKEVDAETAIKQIQKGKRIFIGSGCGEPQHLVRSLVANAGQFENNEIVHIMTMGIAPYVDEKYQKNFRHNAFFIGKNVRKAISEGRADYTPVFLSEIPYLFESKQMPIHCALIQVSLPDKNGRVSLGVSVDIVLSAIKNADFVIAQVNRWMPMTYGAGRIPFNSLDYVVYHDEDLIDLKEDEEVDDVSAQIAKHISNLIKDGDTLQMGIGKIPNAVLKDLSDKNALGLHTEMFSDGVIDLYKNGNITNTRKGLNDGYAVTSFVMGTRKLYDLVHRNPDFMFLPSEYVNNPSIIAQHKNMVSINSALQIDLTGQICADSIGTNFYSGIGGQVDFVRGASHSKGGKSIIALPSTAKNGTVSRIEPLLPEGAGIVTSRGDVHYVVTEYGVAYLHGKSARERACALIEIAHPDFRADLLDYAKQRKYII